MSSCCSPPPSQNKAPASTSCCASDTKRRWDYLLWSSATLVLAGFVIHGLNIGFTFPEGSLFKGLAEYGHSTVNFALTMVWGVLLGIFMVALLARVPRAFVMSILGNKQGLGGIARATLAGVFLDLCSHGILMVGAKLYERGASIGQVMAFLIASPWNSFSLTLVLVALIGLPWTLAYIVLSVLVALLTGLIFDALVQAERLPSNPNRVEIDPNFQFWAEAKAGLKGLRFTRGGAVRLALDGVRESRMVLKWLLVGIVLASLIRAIVDPEDFARYLGPGILGLSITMLAATIIEVCSEGSTPIAADIVNRAHAPGNGFAFLMAGVATDYTEIMVIKETTRSWKLALFLPLIALPQVILIAVILQFLPLS